MFDGCVLDLLVAMQVPLIVSVTYDRLLEDRLERANRKYAVVSHVIRSLNGMNDGNVLVVRPGRAPDLCAADHLVTEPGEVVVYKPQGCPFTHDAVDPDLEIDTVVVTEEDHVTFLQRLKNSQTGVPTSIAKRFRRSPLLFLGYAMDVWQYRLMMHVFQAAGRQKGAATIAVRVPEAPIEEVAWRNLNTDLIRMTPTDFAQRALVF
jgi:hypothetical protein